MHHMNVGYCGLETARRYELPVVAFVATPVLPPVKDTSRTCLPYSFA